MEIKKILQHNITGVLGDTSTAKSSLLCTLIEEFRKESDAPVWTYGLKEELTDRLETNRFYSLDIMAKIKNSLIVVEEVGKIFDLENRKFKPVVEEVLRTIDHNNNKLVICGLPYDFKKFISARVKAFIYSYTTLSELINGSPAKEYLQIAQLPEKNYFYLDLPKGTFLYKSRDYEKKFVVPYNEKYDTKKINIDLFSKNVQECAEKSDIFVQKKESNQKTYVMKSSKIEVKNE
jgi:hypothetical protein